MPQPFHQGEYPSDWREIAQSVKQEAGWACVRCSAPHNPGIGRCLTVHHFDGNKGNCARWNLMALCQACHLSVQARVDPATPLLFRPALWSMPYIAGLYASGATIPDPCYDLASWIAEYESAGKSWPAWAPAQVSPPEEPMMSAPTQENTHGRSSDTGGNTG